MENARSKYHSLILLLLLGKNAATREQKTPLKAFAKIELFSQTSNICHYYFSNRPKITRICDMVQNIEAI